MCWRQGKNCPDVEWNESENEVVGRYINDFIKLAFNWRKNALQHK